MMHLLFGDLLYQGIQTPRNRRERKDGAFIVSRSGLETNFSA